MVSSGKPYPEYRSYNDAVTLTMYSSIDDRYLTDNGETSFSELETISQSDEDDTERAVVL